MAAVAAVHGLEWSDIVLLCDAASRRPELAATLREFHAAGSAEADLSAALSALDCRTAGRKRRLERALSASDLSALAKKEPLCPTTLVCTHHKEDYAWAAPLLAARPDLSLVIYDCGLFSAPLPASLVGHPRVHIRSKIGQLAAAPFFYSCFDYCATAYDDLPRRTFFLHGHDSAWHQKLSIGRLIELGEAAMHADPTLCYINLNDRLHADWVLPGEKMLHDVAAAWATLAALLGESPSTPPPGRICEVHAAQAMVDCSRIRARDRGTWEALRAHAATLRFHTPEDFAVEGSFHYILGEPWSRPFVEAHMPQLAVGSPNELEIRNRVERPEPARPTPWPDADRRLAERWWEECMPSASTSASAPASTSASAPASTSASAPASAPSSVPAKDGSTQDAGASNLLSSASLSADDTRATHDAGASDLLSSASLSADDTRATQDAGASDLLLLILRENGLDNVARALHESTLTLADCFALLNVGRPPLLERLKVAGVSKIGDRQSAVKILSIAKRDPLQYRRANMSPPPPPDAQAPQRRVMPSESRAQPGGNQDVHCLQFLGGKSGGYYVEVGVADACYHNNTWLLDDAFGWRGLCIDPLATNIEARTRSGRTIHFGVALAGECGTAEFSVNGAYSGLTEFACSMEHNAKWAGQARSYQTTTVPTRTPLQALEAGGAPSVIDYLTVDVEGAEMEVLRAFPFERYAVRFATIETNGDARKERELRSFMRDRGLDFLGHVAHDDYFGWRGGGDAAPAPVFPFDPPLDYVEERGPAITAL